MDNKLLPIGSVIKMYNGDINLMICGYADRSKEIEGEYYDYICCIYPSGINGKESILVKKEKIEKVIFIGYQDTSYVNFLKLLDNN